MNQNVEKNNDQFAQIAIEGIGGRLWMLTEPQPLKFTPRKCYLSDQFSGSYTAPQLSNDKKSLDAELKVLREKMKPFLADLAPKLEPVTKKTELREFVLDGKETVTIPHYEGPIGYGFKTYETEFTVESRENFQGSNYSRSGLWQIPGEPIELWKSDAPLTVTNGEADTAHEGVVYEERLEELDKYTVFLDGNHSLVRIDNPEKAGSGKLLVIRDSYANCLGTFLANSYESVVLVDLRYYKKPVSELLAAEEFADVLVCYSIGNFLTDTNLIWLR